MMIAGDFLVHWYLKFSVAQLVRFKQSKFLFGLRSWIQKKLGRCGSFREGTPKNCLKSSVIPHMGEQVVWGYSRFEKNTP